MFTNLTYKMRIASEPIYENELVKNM